MSIQMTGVLDCCQKGEDGEDESGGGDWGRGELVVAIFKIC